MRQARLYASLLTLVLGLIALSASGCGGSGRSTARFCSQLQQGTADFKTQAGQVDALTQKNALEGLIAAFGGLGDFGQFLDRLDKVAPSQISSDMDVVDQDFRNQLDKSGSAAGSALTGSFGEMAGLIFSSLTHVNSYRRVDEFAAQNCGLSIFGTNNG